MRLRASENPSQLCCPQAEGQRLQQVLQAPRPGSAAQQSCSGCPAPTSACRLHRRAAVSIGVWEKLPGAAAWAERLAASVDSWVSRPEQPQGGSCLVKELVLHMHGPVRASQPELQRCRNLSRLEKRRWAPVGLERQWCLAWQLEPGDVHWPSAAVQGMPCRCQQPPATRNGWHAQPYVRWGMSIS